MDVIDPEVIMRAFDAHFGDPMAKKKRGPTDSTLRNVQATNKKLAALTRRVRALENTVRLLVRRPTVGKIYA